MITPNGFHRCVAIQLGSAVLEDRLAPIFIASSAGADAMRQTLRVLVVQ